MYRLMVPTRDDLSGDNEGITYCEPLPCLVCGTKKMYAAGETHNSNVILPNQLESLILNTNTALKLNIRDYGATKKF